MADKPNYKSLATPAGVAVYPHLSKPDTKFDPDGQYKLTLALPADSEETAEFIATLVQIRDEFFDGLEPKIKKSYDLAPVYEEELDDDGEATGRLLFKTKLKAKITSKKTGETWEQRPALFDADLNAIPRPEKVMMRSGSTVACSVVAVPYAMASSKQVGVSMRLKAVQIIKLIEGMAGDPEALGFTKRTGGYVRPQNVVEAHEVPGGDDDAGDAGDDGDY